MVKRQAFKEHRRAGSMISGSWHWAFFPSFLLATYKNVFQDEEKEKVKNKARKNKENRFRF